MLTYYIAWVTFPFKVCILNITYISFLISFIQWQLQILLNLSSTIAVLSSEIATYEFQRNLSPTLSCKLISSAQSPFFVVNGVKIVVPRSLLLASWTFLFTFSTFVPLYVFLLRLQFHLQWLKLYLIRTIMVYSCSILVFLYYLCKEII